MDTSFSRATSPSSVPESLSRAHMAEQQLRHWQARTWRTVGTVSIAIGLINAFIPLLPTTVFLLVGLWAYGKSDPHLRKRLLAHPRFGAALRRWVDHGQISARAKTGACASIAVSGLITYAVAGSRPVVWFILAGLAGLMAYLVSRPSAQVSLTPTH